MNDRGIGGMPLNFFSGFFGIKFQKNVQILAKLQG
jgi:hypothetical protein